MTKNLILLIFTLASIIAIAVATRQKDMVQVVTEWCEEAATISDLQARKQLLSDAEQKVDVGWIDAGHFGTMLEYKCPEIYAPLTGESLEEMKAFIDSQLKAGWDPDRYKNYIPRWDHVDPRMRVFISWCTPPRRGC